MEWTICTEPGCHERVRIPEEHHGRPLAKVLAVYCWKHDDSEDTATTGPP